MPPIDASGLIPTNIAAQIQTEALQQSIALRLGTRMPMPAGITVMPVPRSYPRATWGSTGSRKGYTDYTLGTVNLVAEEVAAIISIPDTYVEDTSINLWNYSRPLLAEAIAVALDAAAIWGVGHDGTAGTRPASFPVGGAAGMAQTVAAGQDAVATVNVAMATVEQQGLRVNGHAADLVVQGALRGVRDAQGAFLMGPGAADGAAMERLYGTPIAFTSFLGGPQDFITGDWSKLIIGVRSDIRYAMSSEGVIANDAGAVVVSAFQDNQTFMKVWARYGCAIMRPATRRVPAAPYANPFAKGLIGPPAGLQTLTVEEDTGDAGTEEPQGRTRAGSAAGK